MKRIVKKFIPSSIKQKVRVGKEKRELDLLLKLEKDRFKKYSFGNYNNLDSYEQLEARITKAYHSIEKGLSYKNLKLGFGKEVINTLVSLMAEFKKKNYSLYSEFFQTALSNLNEYIKIHESNNFDVTDLKEIVANLGQSSNDSGGVIRLTKNGVLGDTKKDFKSFSTSRHSIRDYSEVSVNIELIEKAFHLAQNTPSACNRQGWKTRVISDSEIKKTIRSNQNGNRGFGESIDKFILITTDSQYFAKDRERNQPFIDGGLYAMNLLYSLHYYGIATVPLSAALTLSQEENIRIALNMEESENFIMFIGVGNYIEEFTIPKSTRRKPKAEYR